MGKFRPLVLLSRMAFVLAAVTRSSSRDSAWAPENLGIGTTTRSLEDATSTSDQRWRCNVPRDQPLDSPETLRWLYGDAFVEPPARGGPGKGTIAVLGLHHAGTSLTTRLIMLMGAYGGRKGALELSAHNPLKFYELTRLYRYHNSVLNAYASSSYKPFHAVRLNLTLMDARGLHDFECFVQDVMAEIGHRRPCVMKDPRMPLLMPLWRPFSKVHAPDLVCLLVYKDPIQNAVRLGNRISMNSRAGSREAMFDATGWLGVWEASMLRSLEGCRGVPTLVADATSSSDVHAVVRSLYTGLTRVGVRGLHRPSHEELEDKVIRFFRPSQRALLDAGSADGGGAGSADAGANVNDQPAVTLSQARLDHAILWALRQQEHMAPTAVAESILELATVS